MLKIENCNFEEKFTEINIRQRVYDKRSILTLMIVSEFYPEVVNDGVVSGSVEIKLDIDGVKCLDDLENKHYEGDIGSINIFVSNDGVFEKNNASSFEVWFGKRRGRKIEIKIKSDGLLMETTAVLVSLYTTSSTLEQLNNFFSLSDFYDNPIVKKIGNSEVVKYFVKSLE